MRWCSCLTLLLNDDDDIQLCLLSVCIFQNCSENDPPCPVGYIDKIVFEMDKRYEETKLQVLVSPVTLHVNDNFQVKLYLPICPSCNCN